MRYVSGLSACQIILVLLAAFVLFLTGPLVSHAAVLHDMEGSLNGWSSAGLWHITTNDAHSGSYSWWYGQENTGDYYTGAKNKGALVTPPITLGSQPQLSFWSWEKTESSGTSWDKRRVFVSTDGGSTWSQIYQSTDNSGSWHEVVLESEIAAYAGYTATFKFDFDTTDSVGNEYKGWLIDDLKVIDLAAGTGAVPTNITLISGSNQVAEVSTTLPLPCLVKVTDSSGNPVSGVEVEFEIAQGDGYMSPSFVLTGDQGQAESYLTLSYIAGEIVIAAASPDVSGQSVQFTAVAYLSGGSTVDYDGDGILNTWEQTYGLDPFDPADADQDSDNDGFSNISEYEDGTDPTSDSNGPAITISQYPASIIEGITSVAVTFDASDTASGNSNVTAAEYFVDIDPGQGSATAVSMGTPATAFEGVTANIDTSQWSAEGSPYTLYIRAQDAFSNWGAAAGVDIYVTSTGTGSFADDMETGTNGWTAGGLWHLMDTGSTSCAEANSGTHSWWYGQDSTCDYYTGSKNQGSLISPYINLGADPQLSFWSWEKTESSGTSWDKRRVYISTNGGSTWTQVYQSTNNSGAWHLTTVDLGAYAWKVVQIKFDFDTTDSVANKYKGWVIDDVNVTSSGTESIQPSQIAKTAGDNQAGVTGSVLSDPLIVTVTDIDGNPVPGVLVQFAVVQGGAEMSADEVATDASGQAQTFVTLGSQAQALTVAATAAVLPGQSVVFNLNAYLAGGDASDYDGDDIPNTWELDNGLDPYTPGDAVQDWDNDGLSNLDEYTQGFDPNIDSVGPSVTISQIPFYLAQGTPVVSVTISAGDTLSGNSNVVAAEYFIGSDPGKGSGTAVSMAVWAPSVETSFQIDSSGWQAADAPYLVYIRAKDAAGNWGAAETASITVTGGTPDFADGMESGQGDWAADGVDNLWHITSKYAHSPSYSWWYGKEDTGNYYTGAKNKGALITPAITLGSQPQLSFWSWEKTESSGTSWDRRRIYVSTDQGSTWTQVYQSTNNDGAWHQVTVDLDAYAWSQVKIKFDFDTIDSVGNEYKGWLIDDVTVESATGAGAAPPAQIAVVSGNNQTGAMETTLGNPLVVKVSDSGGNPVPGVPVQFSVTQGTAELFAYETVTDANGEVQTSVSLGTMAQPGTVNVSAVSTALEGKSASFALIAYLPDGSADDYDGDGMPNAWEGSYSLDQFNQFDADQDADSDGLSNLAEYTGGTDPTADSNGPSINISQFPSSIAEGTKSSSVSFIADDIAGGNSNIIAAEYFSGSDPGQGAGTPVTVGAATSSVTLSFNLNTAGWTAAGSPYQIYVRAKDAFNNWSTAVGVKIQVLAAGSGQVFDMESGITGGWAADGLWHITSNDAHGGSYSWWYGQEGTGNYYTGAKHKGSLITPPLSLGAQPQLSFWSWEKTESSGTSWDKRRIFVSTDGGSTWSQVYQSTDNSGTWHEVVLKPEISAYAGDTVKFKFEFDTVDSVGNKYKGWLIDDVQITGGGQAIPVALSIFSGDGQTAPVQTSLDNPLVIKIAGSGGAGISGVAVKFEQVAGNGTLSAASVLTDGDGLAQVTFALGDALGTYQIKASSDVLFGSSVLFQIYAVSGQGSGSDLDGDGIPNQWEINNGLNPEDPDDALEDPDNDGLNNQQEYELGTGPKVSDAPAMPVLDSPSGGAVLNSTNSTNPTNPTLILVNVADPNELPVIYDFEVYSDTGLKNLIADKTEQLEDSGVDSGKTAWQVSVDLEDNTTYYWRARAVNSGGFSSSWSTPFSFVVNIQNDLPTAPGISYPAGGKWVDTTQPRLEVTNAKDKDGDVLTYTFEISTEESMNPKIAGTTQVSAGTGVTFWEVDNTALTNGTTYYWRAKAVDTGDDTGVGGPWSVVSYFKVDESGSPPGLPVIESPANGTELDSPAITLKVTNAAGSGINYYFELDAANTFDSPALQTSGAVSPGDSKTSWTPAALEYATTYYWRVKAGSGNYDSVWVNGAFAVKALGDTLFIGKGWNLLSTPVQLQENSVADLFAEIKTKVKYIWSWDQEGWKVFFPFKTAAFQAEYIKKKNIKIMETVGFGQGFYVYGYAEALLNTEGTSPANTDMVLSKGWNMVGLKITTSISLADLFADDLNPGKKTYIESVWKWDRTKSKWLVALPAKSDSTAKALLDGYGLDQLETLKSGEGYWILAKEAMTLKVE